ncbi:BZ3500_MvSof-1268-A1-R1_Chr11-2g03396 [Microbotryum saponariae]|uniref:Decapping nuclease n=1 Tax=Microbotryum saponariae TaxID=289078 RepID=A0A2X0M2P1_9BASI|nr:BZ3500_MvSof-1268-A1-R1_Chr11-2g03396 [Microbotryum saponariae]SDA03285.1 BZ3501_MvSof-1269-A2-R1_Chr11g02967 [Microbotryum saponariae]
MSPSPTIPLFHAERPLKRRRANSFDQAPSAPRVLSPAPAPAPGPLSALTTPPLSKPNKPYYRPIPPPLHPLSAPPTRPIAFQQPLHLTSFSYSPTRQLLLTPQDRDASLAVYTPPRIGTDLNTGFEQAVWRDDSGDEGLDALLQHYVESDPTGAAGEMLDKVNIITWRGMITKLLLAVYEVEAAHNDAANSRRTRAEGWEMNLMLLGVGSGMRHQESDWTCNSTNLGQHCRVHQNTLYLEESKTPARLEAKAASEKSYLRQSYYGYSFEAFSTRSPQSTSSYTNPTFEPPNTNVQWCSIVKTNLGGFRMFLGGEVDCLRAGWTEADSIRTDDFVELKTNIVISSQRDEMMFERQKLLKHYTQSFLLGVPTIIVGFRTRTGHLSALQSFKTLEIPRLHVAVRNKPHAWSPTTSLTSAFDLIQFIISTLSSDENNQAAEEEFKVNGKIPEQEWPVWRMRFRPLEEGRGGGGVLELVQLTGGVVEEEVLGGKRKEERVGFLLKRWVEGLGRRGAGTGA